MLDGECGVDRVDCVTGVVCGRVGVGVSDSGGSMSNSMALLAFPQSSSCASNQYSIPSYSQDSIAIVRNWTESLTVRCWCPGL